MVAAERGYDQIKKYFYLRECVLCKGSSWTWNGCCEGISMNDNLTGVLVTNTSPVPTFACVLGSDKFICVASEEQGLDPC